MKGNMPKNVGHGFLLSLNLLYTPWKLNSSPLKIYHPKRKVVFQLSFFKGYVKLRGCIEVDFGCFLKKMHVRVVCLLFLTLDL